MRPGSLGKRSSSPEQRIFLGKASMESLTMKLLQNLGLLRGVRHIPTTAGVHARLGRSPKGAIKWSPATSYDGMTFVSGFV